MPLAAKIFSSLFFSDSDIITGFILFFSGPTAISGFFWVMIFNGSKPLSLTLILLSTVLAPILVPGTLSVLMGQAVVMDMTGIAILLIMMVVLPTIIGVTVNEVSKGKVPHVVCPYLEPIAKLCLIAVIAANSSSVAGKINFNEPFVWKAGILCILLLILGFFLVYTAALLIKCKRDKCISLVMAGGLRNNSAVMTIAVAFFPEMVSLPIIICLIFQQSIAAAIGNLLFRKNK
jgi:tagaturonate reductase